MEPEIRVHREYFLLEDQLAGVNNGTFNTKDCWRERGTEH
jgi:hypothetical protein